MFAGCWDKHIWSWDRESRIADKKYSGHSDFVKVIICAKVGGKDVRPLPKSQRYVNVDIQSSASYLAAQTPKL